jgi:hypothetical protein
MDYYLCDVRKHKVLRGPMTSDEVVELVDKQVYPKLFCNMSRHYLAKEGWYPKGKAGNLSILKDLEAAQHRVERTSEQACPSCSGVGRYLVGDFMVLCDWCEGTGQA